MARCGFFDTDGGCVGSFAGLFGSNLVLCILAHLDIATLIRLRCVCKSWYDAITGVELSSLRSKLSPLADEQLWLLLRERTSPPADIPQGGYIYDPDLHFMFYDYSLEIKARMRLWQPWNSSNTLSALPAGPPLSSSLFLGLPSSLGGLVCGMLMEEKHKLVFAVGNPVLNRWKILPEAPSWRMRMGSKGLLLRPPYITYGLVRSSNNCGYKLVVSLHDRNTVKSLVQYDSQDDVWIQGAGFKFASSGSAAVENDAHELLLTGSIFFLSESMELIAAYSANTMKWYCFSLPDFPTNFGYEFVFKHEQRRLILMAGLFVRSFTGFGVWKLDLETKSWKLVSRVEARDILGPEYDLDDCDVKLQLVGDWLVFSCWYKNSTFQFSFPPISYHIPTCQWKASSAYTGMTDFECCYAFQPSLTDIP